MLGQVFDKIFELFEETNSYTTSINLSIDYTILSNGKKIVSPQGKICEIYQFSSCFVKSSKLLIFN